MIVREVLDWNSAWRGCKRKSFSASQWPGESAAGKLRLSDAQAVRGAILAEDRSSDFSRREKFWATLVLDISSSERLLGTPQQIAEALRNKLNAAGLEPSLATSGNANAAVLAARAVLELRLFHPGKKLRTGSTFSCCFRS